MEIRPEQRTAAGRNEPQSYSDLWTNHRPGRMLSSSANRGWSGLSAELWTYGKGVIPWRGMQSGILVCVDISGNGSLETRRASGIVDQTATRRGTTWMCPPGWQEGSIDIADDLPEIVHFSLALNQFSPGRLGLNIDASAISALRYESAFEDPLLGDIASAIVSEMQAETSAGRLLVESLANSMAARPVQKHISAPRAQSVADLARGGLDRRRLSRVLDYIEANLEGDLNLDGMASIACLSRYHFARAFKQAVGQSPHRYVSAKRLELAKALLIQGNRPLVDIALALGFSSQANFTRTFTLATGLAPGQYRRELGSPYSQLWHSGRRFEVVGDPSCRKIE